MKEMEKERQREREVYLRVISKQFVVTLIYMSVGRSDGVAAPNKAILAGLLAHLFHKAHAYVYDLPDL